MVNLGKINKEPKVISHLIGEKEIFPNNDRLPLFIIQSAFLFGDSLDPEQVERTFAVNLWKGSWRNGLYPFHHYHSTAHEVLGIYSGSLRAQFGGDKGIEIAAAAGDVLILPAGLAHKNVWSSFDFRVVGAYPAGTTWDMNYGKEGERPEADENISKVPLPTMDPVYGANGFLMKSWKN